MPDDIVEVLRRHRVAACRERSCLACDCADEIERLRNDISTLEKEIAMVVPCHHKDGRHA